MPGKSVLSGPLANREVRPLPVLHACLGKESSGQAWRDENCGRPIRFIPFLVPQRPLSLQELSPLNSCESSYWCEHETR